MPESEQPVKPVRVTYMCDFCGKGEMVSTGTCLTSLPALYPHRCNKCDVAQSFHRTYPYIAYRSVE